MKTRQVLKIIKPRLDELIGSGVVGFYKSVSTIRSTKLLKTYKGLCFVYFIIESNHVTYIGSTRSIWTRQGKHKRGKLFDHIFLINFDTRENMLINEKELIRRLKPEKNTRMYKKTKTNYLKRPTIEHSQVAD